MMLPLPPLEMRELVGATDEALWDNPTGEPIWPGLPESAWDCYLDFGCGCGREARRMLLQTPRPKRYVGVDLHQGMIQWCQENLTPVDPNFEFVYHPVFNAGLNPNRLLPYAAPLPLEDGAATLMEAHSVFTHLIESQAEHYLDEVARVLAPDGILVSTWFLFDKTEFPFMQDTQNALYINDRDPTNAVVFDRVWLYEALAERGLAVVEAKAPAVRGYHWHLRIARVRDGVEAVDLPPDTAPPGRYPPPLLRAGAHRIGIDADATQGHVSRERMPLPQPDPLAVELAGAKEYIASLEAERAARAAAPAPPAGGLVGRIRNALGRSG